MHPAKRLVRAKKRRYDIHLLALTTPHLAAAGTRAENALRPRGAKPRKSLALCREVRSYDCWLTALRPILPQGSGPELVPFGRTEDAGKHVLVGKACVQCV